MTDIELLPSSVAAFVEALKGERGSLDAWLEVNNEREVAAHVEAYARAVAEHNVKERDAEIEALREDVASWKAQAMRNLDLIERLEEALREAHGQVRELCDCYGHAYPEASFARYEALLRDHDQEGGNP